MKKKTTAIVKSTGRPTKYRPEYCDSIIKYFRDAPKFETFVKERFTRTLKTGTVEVTEKYGYRTSHMPEFFEFAEFIGVSDESVLRWKNKYIEFRGAYNKAKQYQKQWLVEVGLSGFAPPASFIFVTKNVTDMKDEQKIDHTTKGKRIDGFNYVKPNGTNQTDNQTDTKAA